MNIQTLSKLSQLAGKALALTSFLLAVLVPTPSASADESRNTALFEAVQMARN